MPQLGPVEVPTGSRRPVVDGIVDHDIPEISEEQSYGDGSRQAEAQYTPQRKERSYDANGKAHPCRRADQCSRIAMVAVMHHLDDRHVVKDETMQ